MSSANWQPFCLGRNVAPFHIFLLIHTYKCLRPGQDDKLAYRQSCNIRGSLVGNKIVDHSDVVGASPIGAAPTTSSVSIWNMSSVDWTNWRQLQDEARNNLLLGVGATYFTGFTVVLTRPMTANCLVSSVGSLSMTRPLNIVSQTDKLILSGTWREKYYVRWL